MLSFKTRLICVQTIVLFFFVMLSVADAENDVYDESRGKKKKKKKIALFLYFAELVVKKIFILKLIYAFVFWLVIHKAGYFLGWFIAYLKDKKKDYIEHDHHEHYVPHHHYKDYSSYSGFDHGDSYSPYKRQAHGL